MIHKSIFLFFTLILSHTTFAQDDVQIEHSKSKFSISGGINYSYRTASLADNLSSREKEHLQGLRNGYSIFLMPRYQLNESYSLGFSYRNFKASNTTDNFGWVIEDVTVDHVDEETTFVFLGPSVHYHYINPSNELNMYLSMGVMSFTSEATLERFLGVTSVGNSFGVDIGFEYLFNLSNNLFLGGSMSYTTGTINEVETSSAGVSETIELDEPESLNHFSIGPVIRLYL